MDIMHRVVELRQDLEVSYLDYAMETITDRALPRLEDGLKPVHRRILYAMHTMGLTHHQAHKKSARVVGEVLGKYHPHGDSSVYMAMVRMAQDFSLREMLVDGQGNFGSIDGDAPAAMRYTEARLAAIAAEMVRDIERDTVDWAENFDGSLKEPVILPATLPNLLVNGSSGVAVGMATNMPPHNLGEICDGLVHVTGRWEKRDRITVDELLRLIPGPDFPTGGVAYRYRFEPGRNGDGDQTSDTIRDAYESGRSRIVTQARVDIEPVAGGKADIVVSELPYMVQKSTVLEKIAKEVRDGRISGVTDLRDESDYTGMRIVIEVGRGSDPREVLAALLTYTQLRQTFGVINLALVEEDGDVLPRMLSLREILIRFVAHRLNVIERRSRHELAEREARLHIVEGLLAALDVIDEIISTIKKSKTTDTARANLMKQFGFSEAQAGAILSMQLRRLAALERKKLQDEAQELKRRIKYLTGLLGSEARRLQVVIEETEAIKQAYGTPRRTVILDDREQAAGMAARMATAVAADLDKPQGPQVVALTTRGVVRTDAAKFSYRVKEGVLSRAVEAHLSRFTLEPEDSLLLVSNLGRVWKAGAGMVPRKASFAELGLNKGEILVGGGVVVPDVYLVIGTRAGNIKRVGVDELKMGEASWAEIIGLSGQGDEVLFAGLGSEQAEVMFFTASGKANRFIAAQVNPQATPSARGVVGVKVAKGDRLVAGSVFEPDNKRSVVVVVSETGYGKQVKLSAFPVQGRGGQGVQSLELTKATGRVAAAVVTPDGVQFCDVLSAQGLRQRVALDKLPAVDRRKGGEQVVAFEKDDLIRAVALF